MVFIAPASSVCNSILEIGVQGASVYSNKTFQVTAVIFDRS